MCSTNEMMKYATLSSLTSLRILLPILLILIVIALYLRNQQIKSEAAVENQQTGKGNDQSTKRLVMILLIIYMLIFISLTFLYRRRTRNPQINLTFFWSYKEAFQLTPFRIRRLGLARQILLNILLTVPLGFLLPLLYHGKKHPWIMTALTTLGLSILTETFQYLLHLGLCEADDVIDNLLGCLLGMAILSAGTKIIQKCLWFNLQKKKASA